MLLVLNMLSILKVASFFIFIITCLFIPEDVSTSFAQWVEKSDWKSETERQKRKIFFICTVYIITGYLKYFKKKLITVSFLQKASVNQYGGYLYATTPDQGR